MRFRIRASIVAAALAVLAVVGGATAYAVGTYRAGRATTNQYLATQSNAWMVPAAGVWQTVPSTGVAFTTTASRVIDARFAAESQCAGPGWCSVRIIYSRNGGAFVELAPQSGTDYAFDSGSDTWEGHAMERSSAVYLPAGSYRVLVQAQRVGGATSFRLDDYHLHVGLVAP